MWGKCFLNKIYRLDIKIKQIEDEIIRLQLTACGSGGLNTSERVQTSITFDKMGEAVAEIVELEKQMYETNSKMNRERFKIIEMIQRLENPKHVQVLYKRFVERKRWEVIAVEMGYDYNYVQKMCKKALKRFENKYTIMKKDIF